jgi:hypothetical protein
MHLMIDFETLGTLPETAVVSLGAVLFENDKILETNYWEFKIQDQLDKGRTVTEDTLRWWFSGSSEASEVLTKNGRHNERVGVEEFCIDFTSWTSSILKKNGNAWKGLNVWGNGAAFDVPILDSLFLSIGFKIPYMFWNVMCFRTLNRMYKITDMVERGGTHHNAEDDAIYQTECVIAWFAKQKKGKK